jgi:Rha family phage regulatory protein
MPHQFIQTELDFETPQTFLNALDNCQSIDQVNKLPLVFNHNGISTAHSVRVAAHFGRRHSNITRSIRTHIFDNQRLVNTLNVERISYKDSQNRVRPAYLLDFWAFSRVVMAMQEEEVVAGTTLVDNKVGEFKDDFLLAFMQTDAALRRVEARYKEDMAAVMRIGVQALEENKMLQMRLDHAQSNVTLLLDTTRRDTEEKQQLEQSVAVLSTELERIKARFAATGLTKKDFEKTFPVGLSYREAIAKGHKLWFAEELTDVGLLHRGDVFRLFAESWQDPTTGELVKMPIWQKFVQQMFFIKNSKDDKPRLKVHEALRAMKAGVFIVKVPTTSASEATTEESSVINTQPPRPAFNTTAVDYDLRPSVRLSAAGIEYLMKQWPKWIACHHQNTTTTEEDGI